MINVFDFSICSTLLLFIDSFLVVQWSSSVTALRVFPHGFQISSGQDEQPSVGCHGEESPRFPEQSYGYSCGGSNRFPEISWTNAPADTKFYALIIYDTTAPLDVRPNFVSWNIPVNVTSISSVEDFKKEEIPLGLNYKNTLDYVGPCPALQSDLHCIKITLYALTDVLPLPIDLSSSSFRASLTVAAERKQVISATSYYFVAVPLVPHLA